VRVKITCARLSEALSVKRATHDGAHEHSRTDGDSQIMYKPNFCAECGAQVLRADWHFWTSRRFCADCARRFRKERILLPLIISTGLFATGLLMGRAARPAAPPLTVERATLPLVAPAPPTSTKNGTQMAETGTTNEAANKSKEGATASQVETFYGPNGTPTERPTAPDETVSICGARTQKGTPCQRRVRGTGRCWQHKGLPAMLPPSKLIVQK
jgi:hypothetical protein